MKIPELSSAEAVSSRIVRRAWKKISERPFPEVYAFVVDDNDFFFLLERVQENPGKAYTPDFIRISLASENPINMGTCYEQFDPFEFY
jgi:hypothetical protein